MYATAVYIIIDFLFGQAVFSIPPSFAQIESSTLLKQKYLQDTAQLLFCNTNSRLQNVLHKQIQHQLSWYGQKTIWYRKKLYCNSVSNSVFSSIKLAYLFHSLLSVFHQLQHFPIFVGEFSKSFQESRPLLGLSLLNKDDITVLVVASRKLPTIPNAKMRNSKCQLEFLVSTQILLSFLKNSLLVQIIASWCFRNFPNWSEK